MGVASSREEETLLIPPHNTNVKVTSITFTVLSSELEATSLPDRERAQHVTLYLWPLKSAKTIPVDESHSYMYAYREGIIIY